MLPKSWHKAARQHIPRHVRDTYFALASHCFGDKRTCHPSQRRLAAMIDAAPSTINDHIGKLAGWNVLRRTRHGRYCEYELRDPAEWRVPPRRHRNPPKAKVCADCSEISTEKRTPYRASLRQRTENPKNSRVSLPGPQQFEIQAKRVNMIKSLRRWCEVSPHLADDERPHRLQMLARAEGMLDNWAGRSREDRACFEILVTRSKAMPLDTRVVQSLTQRPLGMSAIGAFLPTFPCMPGNRAAGSLGIIRHSDWQISPSARSAHHDPVSATRN
ncbi:MAG: hypothetical protein JO266_01705 [Acidobacteria bacterium]|nr:hypothetical protein [Acidobacteriota bacterium]